MIDGMKTSAIAAALGMSVGAVKMRRHRALGELRDLLRRQGLEPS